MINFKIEEIYRNGKALYMIMMLIPGDEDWRETVQVFTSYIDAEEKLNEYRDIENKINNLN